MKVIEEKKSLFQSNGKRTALFHACNTFGKCERGIAVEFKKRFPECYHEYVRFCKATKTEEKIGKCLLVKSKSGIFIAWLFTSKGYGKYRDSEEKILVQTESALNDFLKQLEEEEVNEIKGCKINNGCFAVPWKRTLEVFKRIDSNRTIVICTLK